MMVDERTQAKIRAALDGASAETISDLVGAASAAPTLTRRDALRLEADCVRLSDALDKLEPKYDALLKRHDALQEAARDVVQLWDHAPEYIHEAWLAFLAERMGDNHTRDLAEAIMALAQAAGE